MVWASFNSKRSSSRKSLWPPPLNTTQQYDCWHYNHTAHTRNTHGNARNIHGTHRKHIFTTCAQHVHNTMIWRHLATHENHLWDSFTTHETRLQTHSIDTHPWSNRCLTYVHSMYSVQFQRMQLYASVCQNVCQQYTRYSSVTLRLHIACHTHVHYNNASNGCQL